MNIFNVVLYILLCVSKVQCARILFVSLTPSPSHQKPFRQVWKALALKGHEVHVVTPNPIENNTIPKLIQYDISEVYTYAAHLNKNFAGKVKYTLQKPDFLNTFTKEFVVIEGWHVVNKYALNLEPVKKLIGATPKLRFDAVIVEWLYPTNAAFGAYFEAPLIGICSLGAPTNGLDAIGNILNPVVTPDQNIPLPREEFSFRERLLSVLYSIWIRLLFHWYVLPMEDKIVKERFGQNMPYLGDIERNISLLLLNRNQVQHRMMQELPGVVEYGGFQYENALQALDSDLKKFLDESTEGVIYFSLGSAIKSALIDENIIARIRDVFSRLPYKVVWKWEEDTMPGKPRNVYLSKWIAQPALLDHPNVKLFITQGGLQSTEEAIAAHKPIIGLPFHSDQTANVDSCVKYGMGKMLDMEDLNEAHLYKYIMEIMENPRYAENARKLDELIKDQPQDGIEKAVWWIEYVIRHKGAKHLRSIVVDLPWWQYLMLDIFSFFVAVILTLFVICKLSVRIVISSIRKIRSNSVRTSKRVNRYLVLSSLFILAYFIEANLMKKCQSTSLKELDMFKLRSHEEH